MNKLALIFTAALAFVSTNTFAAGDATKGKVLSATCTACHGANGAIALIVGSLRTPDWKSFNALTTSRSGRADFANDG